MQTALIYNSTSHLSLAHAERSKPDTLTILRHYARVLTLHQHLHCVVDTKV